MKNEKLEEQKILEEGDKMYSLAESNNWKLARKKLIDIIIENTSIDSINMENRQVLDVGIDALAKKIAINIVTQWMNSVEGDARNYLSDIDVRKEFEEQAKESFFVNLE